MNNSHRLAEQNPAYRSSGTIKFRAARHRVLLYFFVLFFQLSAQASWLSSFKSAVGSVASGVKSGATALAEGALTGTGSAALGGGLGAVPTNPLLAQCRALAFSSAGMASPQYQSTCLSAAPALCVAEMSQNPAMQGDPFCMMVMGGGSGLANSPGMPASTSPSPNLGWSTPAIPSYFAPGGCLPNPGQGFGGMGMMGGMGGMPMGGGILGGFFGGLLGKIAPTNSSPYGYGGFGNMPGPSPYGGFSPYGGGMGGGMMYGQGGYSPYGGMSPYGMGYGQGASGLLKNFGAYEGLNIGDTLGSDLGSLL